VKQNNFMQNIIKQISDTRFGGIVGCYNGYKSDYFFIPTVASVFLNGEHVLYGDRILYFTSKTKVLRTLRNFVETGALPN
jgi:hypothetical protein